MTAKKSIDGFLSVIPELLDPATDKPKEGFGGGAGIAIVKPHHPFHRAYGLAEDLIQNAKTTKVLLGDAVSALDFQVVYQDAASDIDKLRGGWEVRENEHVHARPYVVSENSRYKAAEEENRRWADRHHLDTLVHAIETLAPPGKGAPTAAGTDDAGLPRSQQHVLRGALFEGRDIADERLSLICDRYPIKWEVFGERATSLFFKDCKFKDGKFKDSENVYRTRFLDALELIDIGQAVVENAPENYADRPEAAE